jgi:hypothetical protein
MPPRFSFSRITSLANLYVIHPPANYSKLAVLSIESSADFFTFHRPRSSIRHFSVQNIKMGVTKELLKEGNGTDRPQKGDNILMEYTGWLSDPASSNGRGKE